MPVAPSSTLPRGRWLLFFPLVFCVSCSAGGGAKLNPVEGKLVDKNGPVHGAVVTFHPKDSDDITTLRPVGLTKKDGTFVLTTGKDKGAPAGDYAVTVILPETVEPKVKGRISTEPPDTRDKYNGAYSNRARPPFTAHIKAGQNQLEPFVLK